MGTLDITIHENESVSQGEERFTIYDTNSGKCLTYKFHDYGKIFNIPGLYEELFIECLKNQSVSIITQIVSNLAKSNKVSIENWKVLDLGAGNGHMGKNLLEIGVSSITGADILPEAKKACFRDHPDIYDAYFLEDLTQPSQIWEEQVEDQSFDLLTCVAALGFNDIPPKAFLQSLLKLKVNGYAAFNIRAEYLDGSMGLTFKKILEYIQLPEYNQTLLKKKYVHRLHANGTPLYYYAILMKKQAPVSPEIAEEIADLENASYA